MQDQVVLSDAQLQDLWYILVECSSSVTKEHLSYEDVCQVELAAKDSFMSQQTLRKLFLKFLVNALHIGNFPQGSRVIARDDKLRELRILQIHLV